MSGGRPKATKKVMQALEGKKHDRKPPYSRRHVDPLDNTIQWDWDYGGTMYAVKGEIIRWNNALWLVGKTGFCCEVDDHFKLIQKLID